MEAVGPPLWTTCQRKIHLRYHYTGLSLHTICLPILGIQLFDARVNFFPPLRCNIAVILLTDLIVDHGVKVEWSAYIHLLLHAIFIGNFLLTFYTSHTTDTMPMLSFYILDSDGDCEIYRIVFILWWDFPRVVGP